jgi:hypothetical protein
VTGLLAGILGYLMYFKDAFLFSRLNLINNTSSYYNLTGLHRTNFYRSVFCIREIAFGSIISKEYMLSDTYDLLFNSLETIEQAQTDILVVTKVSQALFEDFFQQKDDTYFSYGMHSIALDLFQSFRNIAKELRQGRNYFNIGSLIVENLSFQYIDRISNSVIVNIAKGVNSVKDRQDQECVKISSLFVVGLVIYTVIMVIVVVNYLRDIMLKELYIVTLLPVHTIGQLISRIHKI